MPLPAPSLTLEAWADARPLDRKIVGVRMAGRWVVALVDETGEPLVGAGRSLHDAIEAAQDEQDSAARRAASPPSVARRAAVLPLADDTEPLLSSARDTREVDAELRAELLEATLSSDVPELCPCGHDWPWAKGQSIGVQHAEGEAYEMRNCPHCGSTRMRVLPFSAREQAAYLHGPGSDEENRAAAREFAR